MARMSGVFRILAGLFAIGALSALGAIIQGATIHIASLAGSLVGLCVCYTVALVLDFWLDLGQRVRYMQMIQERQNEVLKELQRPR